MKKFCPECGAKVLSVELSLDSPPYVKPCGHYVTFHSDTLTISKSIAYPGEVHP